MNIFEPIYNQFKDKPEAAILFLLRTKRGSCTNAIYVNGIGYVDFVWGHKKLGLCKIYSKHKVEFENAGVEIHKIIPFILKNGSINKKVSDYRSIAIQHDLFRAVINLEFDKKNKRYLMTAYDIMYPDRKPAVSGFTVRAAAPQTNNNIRCKDNVLI